MSGVSWTDLGDPMRVHQTQARLGWQARHSDLDTIIRTALAWERRSAPLPEARPPG